ncbi:hypothetical protein [Streptomyces hilarionis]|uniref:hypothetical protein n=1 Tax=Streptomyces hilarionis TaxID=2839954 RepID=UPI002119C8E1|nr:hypothetical protein [Streptomyces hilarionis]MCQ9132387.1 hypothetical protein [Streptomyces hilarionis]
MSGTGSPVVVLDFRGGRDVPVDGADLRRRVGALLPDSGRADAGDLRFLVLDEPDGLTAHAEAYELVAAAPTLGAVSLLCLVVGDLERPRSANPPPSDASDADAPYRTASYPDARPAEGGAGRRLRLASVLQSSRTGVLWAPDPRAGHDPRTADPAGETEAALVALADLLRVREIFDKVLSELHDAPVSVATLSLRVLEHDLTPDARDSAWTGALARFAGGEAPVTGPPVAEDLPPGLAELLGPGPERPVTALLRAGGSAEAARAACERAVAELTGARDELCSVRSILMNRQLADGVPSAMARAVDSLRRYRDVVAGVLRDSGSPGVPPGDALARLADGGVALPEEMWERRPRGGEPDEGLPRCTARWLTSGLPLRAVAARLTALAERIAPTPSAARLRDLERACPEESLGRVSAAAPLYFARARAGQLAPTALAAFVSALAPWPGTLLALLPAAVFLLGGALAGAARPGRAAGGRVHRADAARAVALSAGAGAGFALTLLVSVPRELVLGGVLAGVLGAVLCVGAWWRRAVADWWEATGACELGPCLARVDAVLADALRRQWWAAEERTRCADGARTLAAVLRGAAVEADAGHPVSGPPYGSGVGPAGPDGWSDPGWDESSWPDEGPQPPGAWQGPAQPDAAQGYAGHGYAGHGYAGEPHAAPASASWPYASGTHASQPNGSQRYASHADQDPAGQFPPGPDSSGPDSSGPESSWSEADWPDDPPGDTTTGDWAAPGRPRHVPRVDPPWLHRGAGEGGPDLVPTLVADLADATAAALRGHAGADDGASGAGPAGGARTTLEASVSLAIAAAGLGLRDNGVVPAPPYARQDRARGDASALLGIGAQRVREVLNTASEQGRPLLLCPPAQLSLLSRDPAEARSIAFAPQAVRPVVEVHAGGLGPDAVPAAMVWTASGRYAGTLRLVPLRAGVVENVRVRSWAEDGPLPRPDRGTTGSVQDPGEEWAQR